MAVRRSQNWINQARVDVPHLRSIESAVRNDFDELFSAFVLGESNSYVVRGFEIEMAGSIGSSANGLQLIVEDSAILHGKSDESGTFFQIASGEDNQVLSATTNTRVEGAFTPGALNYVSIEFTRQVDDSTTSQLYLWNPTTQNEITKTLPLAEIFDYKIVISSSLFASNVLPIAIVETDASNNVLSVQDRRPMLFRLGTAGASTPDPFYEYQWDNHAEGRSENYWQSSNSVSSPFRGGDKQILTFKENDEAIKTELKQIKGTAFWYSQNSAGSIVNLRYDLGNTIFTGRGYVEHSKDSPGQVNWDQDMFLTVISTRLKYKIEANAATTDITLSDNQVAYVKLIRNIDVVPQLIFTNGADEVSSVGAIAWTTDLEAGDYVKVGVEDDSSYYQILSVDSASQVTLTENFQGTSTGINGTDAKIAYGNYRTDAAPSTDRHIYISNIEDMPFDADTYWLMLRSDHGGQAKVYIRFLNAELEEGEQIEISDQPPENKTIKMVKGGTWSWDSLTGELTNSASAYVQVAGLNENVNEIVAQSIALASDGDCAYITLKKTSGASVRAVTIANIANVPNSDHIIIIARRTGSEVIVGTSSFALENRDYLTLDGAKSEIDRRLDQLKVQPAQPLNTRVIISASDIVQLNGSKLSLEQRNLLLNFSGAQIDFNTGEVFESDGITSFLGGINNFTPFTIPASEYFYYSISLLPNTVNSDNTISGQILIVPSSNSDAVLLNAPKAPFPNSGIKLANVYVQRNVLDTAIENINFANITSLGVGGSGSGGTGDANENLTRYADKLESSPFRYANTNIASIDEDNQLDGSSTATYDVANNKFKFDENTASVLLSSNQLDSVFYDKNVDIDDIELLSIWDIDFIDLSATYEVSRDGGNNWQEVTMSQIDSSDLVRGYLSFEDEPTNSFTQEYAVANADDILDFDDLNNLAISQKFTVSNSTVYKLVSLYINRNNINSNGYFYASIVRDDSGAPSTDIDDVMWDSNAQNIEDLSVGNNVVDIDSNFLLESGDYHLIITTDDQYKTTYTSNNADKISVRIDSSAGPIPNLRTFDGVWSSELADSTMVYKFEGRELDLRVRITSSISAGDKYLSSYAIFYGVEVGLEFIGSNGDQLLTENHLGSINGDIDRSVSGRGIFLRKPNGVLSESTINNDNELVIYSGEVQREILNILGSIDISNLYINGGLDIAQRSGINTNITITGTSAYQTADRFRVGFTGVTSPVSRVINSLPAGTGIPTRSLNGLRFTGTINNATNTFITSQRVEASRAYALLGSSTFSFGTKVYVDQDCDLIVKVNTPTVINNYASVDEQYSQTIPLTAGWNDIKLEGLSTIAAMSSLGFETHFTATNWTSLSAVTLVFAEFMCNKNSNLYPYTLAGRDIINEVILCQRYYEKSYNLNTAPGSISNQGAKSVIAGDTGFNVWSNNYLTRKREAGGTIVFYSPTNGSSGNADVNATPTAAAVNDRGETSFRIEVVGSILGDVIRYHFTSESEI